MRALWAQREVEQEFVAGALKNERAPKGWPAALLMFHLGMWRERMRNALNDLSEGRPPALPANADEINDAELPNGIGTPLADAAARADHLLAEIIGLYEKLGERPFKWFRWDNTKDAVLANSYNHPRVHIAEYMRENGDTDGAVRLFEDAATDMQQASDTPAMHAIAFYNLACARALKGRLDESLENLARALELRPEGKAVAITDSDLAALREDPRFQELVKT